MFNVKYRMETLSFYAYTDIQNHLEKMAAKGWMLDKIGSSFWKYRRTEPKQLHFYVNYFPGASAFDPHPSDAQKEFHAACEEIGWKLAATSAQMQIFYNEEEHPAPVETDTRVQLESLRNSMKKHYLPSNYAMLFLGLVQFVLSLTTLLSNPSYFLSSHARLVSLFCWCTVIFLSILELGTYYLWLRRAEKLARSGHSLPESHGHTYIQAVLIIAVIMIFLLWFHSVKSVERKVITLATFAYMMSVFGLVTFIKWLLRRLNVPAKYAGIIVFISAFVVAFALVGQISHVSAMIINTLNIH